ncbi:MAG: M20/M25/M40 family metallo-hydrolase, partial [Thermoplasmata archaeon]
EDSGGVPESVTAAIGDPEGLRLLSALVSIAPTNLEDPARHRWEKPNYLRASERIARAARDFGLATRIYDPLIAGDVPGDFHQLPRPNVIIDLDVGAKRTTLILAHYDVVPVPDEQRARWKSPPFTLTARGDGRIYGRGSNDDLGSGVIASLLALKRLGEETDLATNVRLLACCDEETGGEGGIEAIKEHDARLPPGHNERILTADVVLIPDGSPQATAGSSGVAFLDATFERPPPVSEAIAYGHALVGLHELARHWRSALSSPDWPDHQGPEAVITGRATVTKIDIGPAAPDRTHLALVYARAESDAANQIPQSVTLVFDGPEVARGALRAALAALLPPPFHLEAAGPTSVPIPEGTLALSVVGLSGHGGYPHRAHNPVPATLDLLQQAGERGLIALSTAAPSSFVVDLRLPPEMPLAAGLDAALGHVHAWTSRHAPSAQIVAPPHRCRSGYWLPPTHPAAVRLERMLHDVLGVNGIFGEYGGTDASAFGDLKTPAGEPMPALVFGSMDREAHIHEAEESADPRLIGAISEVLYRYARAR